jgi:ferredoxin
MRWGVALCSCNETLRLDPKRLGSLLGLDTRPALFARLPRDEVHAFVDWAGQERADRVLVACCGPPELFQEALAAGGAGPVAPVVLNLRDQAFRPHAAGPGAEAKAARLLRAAMRAAESARPAPERPLRVGPTVLIATDRPEGFHLAQRLEGVARPVLVLDDRSAAFDAERTHPLPWKVNWGRVTRVDGTLGAFRVSVERTQPLSLDACIHCGRCVPVCHTSAISEGLRLRTELCDRCGDCLTACGKIGAIRIPRAERETIRADQVVVLTARDSPDVPPAPRRTGYHAAVDPDRATLDALAWNVLGLVGEFRKIEHVAYDPATCAGGASGHQACGRCIGACPYTVIGRDPKNPLRIVVDQPACEGCGACVAECPTSSLTFTEPSPIELRSRLAALLAPVGDARAEAPVVTFHCGERGQAALADALRLGLTYSPRVLPVGMACLRHVSEADLLGAIRLGAAGVALLGCESCPHGPRDLFLQRVERVRGVLQAFGAGADRVRLVTGDAVDSPAMIATLDGFAASLGPAPVRWDGRGGLPTDGREVIADAVRALLGASRREPGRLPVAPDAPFAVPEVDPAKCTLARACVNACPTHAWRFDEARQALQLRSIACVNCGLCVKVCPEGAITLAPAIPLTGRALDWQVEVQDQVVACLKCGKPAGNRKAILAVEAKLGALGALADTFAGSRRDLLRMCQNCRAAAAMLEMQKGWEP